MFMKIVAYWTRIWFLWYSSLYRHRQKSEKNRSFFSDKYKSKVHWMCLFGSWAVSHSIRHSLFFFCVSLDFDKKKIIIKIKYTFTHCHCVCAKKSQNKSKWIKRKRDRQKHINEIFTFILTFHWSNHLLSKFISNLNTFDCIQKHKKKKTVSQLPINAAPIKTTFLPSTIIIIIENKNKNLVRSIQNLRKNNDKNKIELFSLWLIQIVCTDWID